MKKKEILTQEHIDYVAELRLRMYKLRLNQRALARGLIINKLYTDADLSSLVTSINYAMTCYRYSERYKNLLKQIDELLTEYEKEPSKVDKYFRAYI